MGKGNKQTTTQTSNSTQSTAIDPVIQQQAYQNLNTANQVASNYQPVFQQAPAGFTPDQQAAFEAARSAGTAGQGTINSAISGAQSAMGYKPLEVGGNGAVTPQMISGTYSYDPAKMNAALIQGVPGYEAAQAQAAGYNAVNAGPASTYSADSTTAARLNRGDIRDVSAGNTLDKLPSYQDKFNGFSQGVIDSTLNDLNRARIMSMQNSDAAAARAGAWGSRRDILDAETNRAFADAAARASADLRQQGFQTGVNALQNDLSRQSQADLANQGADTNVFTANANLDQATRLANLDAANAAKRYGADAANQINLANQAAANQAAAFGAQASNAAAAQNAAAQNEAAQFNRGLQFSAQQANQNALNNASQFNSNAANQAGQFNANIGLNQAQANQNAFNQTAQFNAQQNQQAQAQNAANGLSAANLGLNASQTLGNLGQVQTNNAYNNAAILNQIGTQQQALNQAGQNVAYQNAVAQQQAPIAALGIQQSGLSATPYGTTTTGTGNSTTLQLTQPGIGASIGQALQTAAGIAGTVMGIPGVGKAVTGLMGGSNPAYNYNAYDAGGLPIRGLTPAGVGNMSPITLSDKRLKTNIQPIKDPIQAVKRLNGVTYDWKSNLGMGMPQGHDAGLIAQDVRKAVPEAAGMIGNAMAYRPQPILGLMVEAVKELDRKKVSKGARA